MLENLGDMMAQFKVRGAHMQTGREVEFELDAEDVIDAQNQASAMGFATTLVEPVPDDGRPTASGIKSANPLLQDATPPLGDATEVGSWPAVISIDQRGRKAVRVAGMNAQEVPVFAKLTAVDAIGWIFVIAVGTMCGTFLTMFVAFVLFAGAAASAVGG